MGTKAARERKWKTLPVGVLTATQIERAPRRQLRGHLDQTGVGPPAPDPNPAAVVLLPELLRIPGRVRPVSSGIGLHLPHGVHTSSCSRRSIPQNPYRYDVWFTSRTDDAPSG
jgi:hypothetical protein